MNLRKSMIIAVCMGVILPATARHLSPLEALNRAINEKTGRQKVRTINATSDPVLSVHATSDPSTAAVYVFNGDTGFVIVSADDCAPALLGYSDSGTLDTGDIAPGLQYWFDFYADQIAWAVRNGVQSASETESRVAIEPLVKAKWNQGSPYNQDCPKFNGSSSMTGCVATAMAQIINAHKYPETCQGGTVTYNSSSSGYTASLTINFNEVTLDWANMLDSYSTGGGPGGGAGSATTEQKNAVANLMKACGYAVKMNYTPSISTASFYDVAPAYWKYFGYSNYVQTILRDYYTDEEWDALIYGELAAGRPMQYGGDTAGGEGHSFVCDGYDGSGRYHINWGWGGQSDGYFLLTALDPNSHGIGGGNSGYNYNQEATRYIATPDTEFPTDASPYLFYAVGNFSTMGLGADPDDTKVETVELGKTISLFSSAIYGVTYMGGSSVTGQMGIELADKNGDTVELFSNSATTQSGSNIYRKAVTLPTTLANGIYKVKPIYKAADRDEYDDIIFHEGKINTLNMKVSGGQAQISTCEFEEDPEPEIPDEPENPDEPDDPDNPDNPDTPDNPEDPENSGVADIYNSVDAVVNLYTIDGRTVFSGKVSEALEDINTTVMPGLYILVEKTAEGQTVSKKILIK